LNARSEVEVCDLDRALLARRRLGSNAHRDRERSVGDGHERLPAAPDRVAEREVLEERRAVVGAELVGDPDQIVAKLRAYADLGISPATRTPRSASSWAATSSRASRTDRYPRRPMASQFGVLFRVATFGESHGGGVGVVVDGCPPRLALDAAEIQRDLDRRRPGQSRLTTPRQEADKVEILSGMFEGKTLGTPIALLVRNEDARPASYEAMKDVYRPSHADYTYEAKYGIRNWQGGGRASARETIGRVAAGAIARKLLREAAGIEVLAWVSRVQDLEAKVDAASVSLGQVEANAVRCPDAEAAARMEERIDDARRRGDSLGGVVSCVARGVPPGLGEPVFDKLEADLAKGVMSLPASKGFEIGSGFAGTLLSGSEHNDAFVPGDSGPRTASNRSGGVQGGISNGEPILLRVAFKPTATIRMAQQTVDRSGNAVTLEAEGRHDPCVLPRAVPMVEAMVLLVLADHWLRQGTVRN
jgi:chorismate synthase